MEIERELPSLLQMSPRSILLVSAPALSGCRFAEKRAFNEIVARLVFEDRDKRTACRQQVNILE